MNNITDFIEGKIKEFDKRFQGCDIIHPFLRTFSQELIQEVGEEIIGEDDELTDTFSLDIACNRLRAKQRSLLKGIKI